MADIRDPDVERHRFCCEVNYVLRLRVKSRNAMLSYIKLVSEKRGQKQADQLMEACRLQWNKGERGKIKDSK